MTRRVTHLLNPENIRTVKRTSENSQEHQRTVKNIREQSRISENIIEQSRTSEKNSQEHGKNFQVESCRRNEEREDFFY